MVLEQKEVSKCFPFPNPKAQSRRLLTLTSTTASHCGTGASLCDAGKKHIRSFSHSAYSNLNFFKSHFILRKPSHVFPPSLSSWICISATGSMVLQLMLWLPGPIHQQTEEEPGLIFVFSWRKLNTQSWGSFTALPAILLNWWRSCQSHGHVKPSYTSKGKLAKWSPWLLRGWHSRVLYSSPRKLPGWKKEHMPPSWDSSYWSPLCRNTFSKIPFPWFWGIPHSGKAGCLKEWQQGPSIGAHTASDPKKGLPWPKSWGLFLVLIELITIWECTTKIDSERMKDSNLKS